jgi:hypothetical protein
MSLADQLANIGTEVARAARAAGASANTSIAPAERAASSENA